MTIEVNPNTAVGAVRILIRDRNQARPIFEDSEIELFLSLCGDDVKLASAMACGSMAVAAASSGDRRYQDWGENGVAAARALMAHAEVLRGPSAAEESAFDVAEVVLNQFAYRDKIHAEALRSDY